MNPNSKITQKKINKALDELDGMEQLFPTTVEVLTELLARYRNAYYKWKPRT